MTEDIKCPRCGQHMPRPGFEYAHVCCNLDGSLMDKLPAAPQYRKATPAEMWGWGVKIPVTFRFIIKKSRLVRAASKWGKGRWRKMEIKK